MESDAELPTPLTSLLDEISYEGNAKKYRGGGRGSENALTAEVFDALALLPRGLFLGEVIRAAQGADRAREQLMSSIEGAEVHVLPGDLTPADESGMPAPWRLQPDAIISSDSAYCLVEAKRIGGGSFQALQLARTAIAARAVARQRTGFVLVVIGAPPPVLVKGHGRQQLDEALQLADVPGYELPDAADSLSWITWHQIADIADSSVEALSVPDPSVEASIRRLGQRISALVRWHSGQPSPAEAPTASAHT